MEKVSSNKRKRESANDSTQSFNVNESQSEMDDLSPFFEDDGDDGESFLDRILCSPSKRISVNHNQMIVQKRITHTSQTSQKSTMTLFAPKEKINEVLQSLGIQTSNEDLRELRLKVSNPGESNSNCEGDCRNVTRILGNFVISFVKKLAKTKGTFSNYSEILFKVSRKMGPFRYDEDYHIWRKKLSFRKFYEWLRECTEAQKIGCLKRFRQIFSLSFVDEQTFEARHFCIVLKRITKHVLLNEFTRYLFNNSMNERSKQDWKNAAKYIAMLPKFVRAIKEPNALYNLKDKK